MKALIAAVLVLCLLAGFAVPAAAGWFDFDVDLDGLAVRMRRLDRWVDRQFQPGVNNCQWWIHDGDGFLLVQLVCAPKIAVSVEPLP